MNLVRAEFDRFIKAAIRRAAAPFASGRRGLPPVAGGRGRGTTLLEVVLYLGILGLVISSVIAFSIEFMAARSKADALAEVAWNNRFAVSRMSAEIRESAGYDPGASTLDANPSTLVLCVSASPCPLAADQAAFSLSAGRLYITKGGSTLPLTSSRVTVTDFTVSDRSIAGRTRDFRIRVTARAAGGDYWTVAPSATYETTERVRRGEGFSN